MTEHRTNLCPVCGQDSGLTPVSLRLFTVLHHTQGAPCAHCGALLRLWWHETGSDAYPLLAPVEGLSDWLDTQGL